MSIKINTIPEAHEILMGQLPEWFKPVVEYIAIMQAYAAQLSGIESAAGKIENNFFPQTADSKTLKYWESLIGLTARNGDSLAFRRDRVMMRLNQKAPITYWHLRDRMTELFGDDYSLRVDPQTCKIIISVTSSRYGAIDLLYDVINELVPTHLLVIANQEVTNNTDSDRYAAMIITHIREHNIYGSAADAEQEFDNTTYAGAVFGIGVIQHI
jgi:hypothetical protein